MINQCEIYSAKIEAKTRILKGWSESGYFTITIDDKNSAYLKVTDEDEIIWKGNLYDVVKKEVIDNKTIFTCLTDKKENDLINSSNEEIQRQTGNSSSKRLLSIFKSIQLFFEEKKSNAGFIAFENETFAITFSEKLFTAFQNIPSPPPWFS